MITSQLRRRRGAAVLIVDGARELRFPAQARAGTDTSGADVTFRFSNLFVGRPVRASTTRSPPLGGCKVERGGLGGSPARPPALERARGPFAQVACSGAFCGRHQPGWQDHMRGSRS